MKLVDILAWELKVWPDDLGDAVGQAADGTLHNEMEPEDVGISRTLESYTLCKHFISDIVTRAEWQAAVDALNSAEVSYSAENVSVDVGYVTHTATPINPECRIVSPEWDGVGLPPVGIDVQTERGVVQVTAYSPDNNWAFLWVDAKSLPSLVKIDGRDMFRPIRNAEKVAAQERDKAIEEMVYGACGCEPDGGNTTAFMICGFIYDAGYRKDPKPCGS